MSNPLRVLAVEDSADDVELLVNELSRGGFASHAEQVETEEAMRAALASSTWDIVFADYHLPHFSAPEALRVLQSTGLDLPFIVLSGTIGEETAVEMMRAGAHDYILKDNMKRLVPAVQRELAEAEVRRERAMAEESLREKERALNTLMANLPGMAYRCQSDRNWTMELVSQGCEALTGFLPEDLIANRTVSFGDLIHADDQQHVWDQVQAALRRREPFRLTYRITKADGEERWVWEQGVGVLGQDGQVEALEGFITDITDRVASEEALRESEERYRRLAEELEERVRERTQELEAAQEVLVRKERLAVLGELAGSVSHELRNPLGAIKNSVYYLNLVMNEPEGKIAKHLSLMAREIERSNRIISDLLEYARPKPPNLASLDPATLIEHVLGQTETPPNVRVTDSVPPDLPQVAVDLDQMYHLFGNLLINAAQAIPEGGEISVAASHRDGHVTFSVHDTGKGISPQDMERIFEPLFSTKVRGTGLGLSIARIILEGHKGEIWAESDGETGSTFFVKLPVIEGNREPHQMVEANPPGGDG